MAYNILLVDDDPTQARVIETIIQDKMNYNTQLLESGQEAIDLLTSGKGQDIDVVLLDLSMPGVDGISVLNAVKPVKPDLPIIVRTGYDDVDLAIKAMKAGATDFVKKVDEPERLQASINNALRIHVLNDEVSRLKRSIGKGTLFEDIIGSSRQKEEMVELGKKVAKSNIPVFIEGESGVGKELLARAIHYASDRAEKPFIAVNCGAIPENLVESTLFGHEKGSFTGALYKTFGKFREAEGGTVFLDEVGELRPDLQVKLLRVLQNGEIEPVGASKPVSVNVRIISATNKNLSEAVANGQFREDLFYRLNVFPIYVPNLEERKEDIPKMIKQFYRRFAESEGKQIESIADDAMTMLTNFSWRGNIRQLKNAIFRAVVLCEGNILSVKDFPQLTQVEDLPQGDSLASLGAAPVALGGSHLPLTNQNGDIKPLVELERSIIKWALEHYDYRMSKIARKLGIGRSTLYRKLDEMGLGNKKEALAQRSNEIE